uniref:LBH domain-containing protein n=1 Tax=Oryzias latipes TaxID=8090 RepID=A0A3P9HMZ1_ORYLA
MTEVITSVEPGTEDFGGGGAGGEQDSIFPDVHERNPKLSKRLPSIVVEPTDATEVESGELRWPPDEGSSADAQTERRSSDKHTADVEKTDIGGDEEDFGVEMQDSN